MKLLWAVGLLCLVLGGLAGCKTSEEPYYLPNKEQIDSLPERGSIADLNRRRGGAVPPASTKIAPGRMHFLVVHDTAGTPVYVELQRSSGDPALDRRAQHFIIRERRFPAGRADTVLISIDPKEIPRSVE